MLEKSYSIVSQVLKEEDLILWYVELGQGLDKEGQETVTTYISKLKESVETENIRKGD
jgi:hypothetical protein